MSPERVINNARAMMIRGKRFKPEEIGRYEDAVRQAVENDRTEAMMLYFAEVLHDELGFGMKRVSRILQKVDSSMHEWLQPEFNLDDLRLRVFGKTKFLFACDIDDQKRIVELLNKAGYEIKTEEDLL